MTFIFDIGNVLINFKPKNYLNALFSDSVIEEALFSIIFKSKEWLDLDRGTITPEEACMNFCSRAPQYRSQINEAMTRLKEMLTPRQETIDMLPKIKSAGHALYYLSNYPKQLSIYIQNKYPFFTLFNGGVFSCDVHLLKPRIEIYQCFLRKYELDPHDCVFIDDVGVNIKSAECCGMKGILYTDDLLIESFI